MTTTRRTEVETQAAGATLAPGAQPGLPQMVMMMHARNRPTAPKRGGGSGNGQDGK